MTHPGNSEYVLVPREANYRMRLAGVVKLSELFHETVFSESDAKEIFDAMLAAAPAITTWHRIDDPVNPAPKDGTKVLLWARLLNPENGELDDRRGVNDPQQYTGCWNPLDDSWVDLSPYYDGYFFAPTYWQPLPPPPDEGG